jgi:hypothetical protein
VYCCQIGQHTKKIIIYSNTIAFLFRKENNIYIMPNQFTEPLLLNNDETSTTTTTTSTDDLNESKTQKIKNDNDIDLRRGSGNTEAINILCFDISKLKRSWQFIILTTATFVFYLLYGYIQELMYKLPKFNQFSWYLTLVQFFLYTVFGAIETSVRRETKRK